MIKGILKGIKSVNAKDLGKEIALAVVAGSVSWWITEQLKKRYSKGE